MRSWESASEMARVALTLGSGGARGYAHIGVIDEVLARGHEIVAVSGASMGALVGGLFGAGGLDEFSSWAKTLRQRDVLRLVDPSWSEPGAVAADKIMERCHQIVGDVAIESLSIPVTIVATDLLARREVWLQRGPLIPAIRASIAIPGVIAPARLDGRILVDGGLLNPIPMEPTAAAPADLHIAVSLAGPRELPVDRGVDAGQVDDDGPDLKLSDVTSLSMDAVQNLVARYRTAGYPPDVMITVPFSAARTIDFHRATELIPLGRHLAAAALDA